jgi:two-component system heavy metal sensor histidine kinase CusS
MRSVSIGTQLSVLISVVMVALLSGVGAYLDYAFSRSLDERSRREILGKVDLLRHVAARTASEQQIAADPHNFYEPMIGHEAMGATVYGATGELLWSSSDTAAVLLTDSHIAGARELPAIRLERIERNGETRYFRTVLFSAQLSTTELAPLSIFLELDVTDDQAALVRYRETLAATLVAAGLLGVLLAHWAVRLALRRLGVFGRALRELSVDRFDARLLPESFPSELREHVHAYNAMVVRLETAFRRMEEFASDLAHELRTPINNLLLNSQIALTRTRSAQDYKGVIEANIDEFERLSRMVDDMLFLARADDARLLLHREVVALHEEAAKVAAFFEALAEEKSVRIQISGEATVNADRLLLQRVLGNLISNAVRHSPHGSIVSVAVAMDVDAESGEIAIGNRGTPIAPEHLPHLFERFYRGDAARTAVSEGAGLGLAIVKSIVDLHGGQVCAESSAEAGTVFRVVLPLSRAQRQSPSIWAGTARSRSS